MLLDCFCFIMSSFSIKQARYSKFSDIILSVLAVKMSKVSLKLFLLLVATVKRVVCEGKLEIISFTQSSEAVTLQENMTFHCEAYTTSIDWHINETSVEFAGDEFTPIWPDPRSLDEVGSLSLQTISLIVKTTMHVNNTRISCYVQGNGVYVISPNKYFIIADSPLSPGLSIYNHQSHQLTVSWDDPFTHPGFNVTHYTVQLLNRTNNETTLEDVGLNHTFSVSIDSLPDECHELEFCVTAFNQIGNRTGCVNGGFPIDLTNVTFSWNVLYQVDGTPHLEMWFEPVDSCSFQEVNYTVYVTDAAGEFLNPIEEPDFTKGNFSGRLYSLHSGLTGGASYTLTVEVRSIVGLAVTTEEIEINKQQLYSTVSDDYEQPSLKYVVSLGVLSVLCVFLLSLFVTSSCLYCKQQKKKKARDTLTEIEVTTNISAGQRPASLPTKCAATNPIYEGPLYESPSGEPLRALLGSTPSTPNTPLDSPRYFDMPPPNLPPPRKASVVSLPHNSLSILSSSAEMGTLETASNVPVMKTSGEDEYTVMKPARVRSVRAPKPSPLVIPGLSVHPEI